MTPSQVNHELVKALEEAAKALDDINCRLPGSGGLSAKAVARLESISHDAAYHANAALSLAKQKGE